MDAAPAERRLGDYHLKEKLAEDSLTVTWLAEQEAVARLVLIDELKPEHAGRSEEFLVDVRAKAAVNHPLVGSVYEAVAAADGCFYAHERLPGGTLDDRRNSQDLLQPLEAAQCLRRIAEANLYLEANQHATSLLGPESVHLDGQGVVRLKNLVVSGTRTADQSVRDIRNLGGSLPDLVFSGRPGHTRILTLLGWMRGEGLPAPLTWKEVKNFAEQIEQQLAEPVGSQAAPATLVQSGKRHSILLIGAFTAVAFITILILAVRFRPSPKPPPPPIASAETVLIESASYPTPDGGEEMQAAFRMAAHEVTIGQYASFLETLAVLAEDGRGKIFDHPEQPLAKSTHEPDDWRALLAAARSGQSWRGTPVTLDTPVVGVDWWDAAAFAEWKRAELPTQEQWFAALHAEADASPPKPGPWLPVTAVTQDLTPAGVRGMAGSVAEWTRRPAVNPANPLGQRLWVIVGGSYLNPAMGAATREWTDDRSLRRPDLGFRIVFPP
jgi:hypothetical protein